MNKTEDEGPSVEMDNPLKFDKVRLKIAQGRLKDKNGVSLMRTDSAAEREIQAKLNKPIQVNFKNVPLVQAIDDIRHMTNMNIYLETESLSAEAISPETPVTLEANNVSLKAALQRLARSGSPDLRDWRHDAQDYDATRRPGQARTACVLGRRPGHPDRRLHAAADFEHQHGHGANRRAARRSPEWRRHAHDQPEEHAA